MNGIRSFFEGTTSISLCMEPCLPIRRKNAAMLLRKKKKGNNVNGSYWTELPDELLEMTSERQVMPDCLSFVRVCRVWRNIVAATPYKQSYGLISMACHV